MPKTLGAVTLPATLQWTDRYDAAAVAQDSARAVNGDLVVWAQGTRAGRPITLEAYEPVAWFAQATVEALQALADVPGATYALDWEGEAHTVVFDHARGALSFQPVFEGFPQFFGRLRLLTV